MFTLDGVSLVMGLYSAPYADGLQRRITMIVRRLRDNRVVPPGRSTLMEGVLRAGCN